MRKLGQGGISREQSAIVVVVALVVACATAFFISRTREYALTLWVHDNYMFDLDQFSEPGVFDITGTVTVTALEVKDATVTLRKTTGESLPLIQNETIDLISGENFLLNIQAGTYDKITLLISEGIHIKFTARNVGMYFYDPGQWIVGPWEENIIDENVPLVNNFSITFTEPLTVDQDTVIEFDTGEFLPPLFGVDEGPESGFDGEDMSATHYPA